MTEYANMLDRLTEGRTLPEGTTPIGLSEPCKPWTLPA